MNTDRIYLSPPQVGDSEQQALIQTLEEGWIAPLGPQLDQFEQKLESQFSGQRVLALNSGTSALHLALLLAGVEQGDDVIIGSFTFCAAANATCYVGARPVFMDSEEKTWNMDPDLLKEYVRKARSGPKAVIVTHLYGMPAKIDQIRSICNEFGITLVEDAAEALGSTYDGTALGGFGTYGILSFNGNKIVTTGGGGALIANKKAYKRGLHLAMQANKGKYDYEHEEVGYNVRMSNVLAGLGIAQLDKLEIFVEKKRAIFAHYKERLAGFFDFHEEDERSASNRWLTTPLLKESFAPVSPLKLIEFLDTQNIESRRLWKPLHLQPAFDGAEFIGSGASTRIYERGLCLPSGVGLTKQQQEQVVASLKQQLA